MPLQINYIYVDGTSDATPVTDITGETSPTANFKIGGISGSYFNGQIDETRVYNRALSQSEITELYQQGQTKINASQDGKLEGNLVGYWSFDGADMTATQAVDKSPSARNGTLTGTTRVIGKIGQGLAFNGTSNKINVSGFTTYYGAPISYGAWIKLSATPSADQFVMLKSGEFYMKFNATSITCHEDNSGQSGVTKTITLTPGQWYHVFCVFKATGPADGFQSIYINGTDSGAIGTGIAPSPYGASLNIGTKYDNYYFNGQMDEVRIYNKILSDSEIMELYQQGQTKINASQTNKLTNGLVVYQSFDGNHMDWSQASAEARDQSGNNNHGDVTNMTNAKAAIGKVGQALNFDGTGDYVNMGDVNALDGQSYLTTSAWVKLNAIDSYDQILGKALAYNNSFHMSIDNDTYPQAVGVSVNNGGFSYVVTPSLNLTSSIGSWHLWTMVFDGTQTGNSNRLKFYYDGIQQTLSFEAGYDNIPASTPNVTSNLHIGKDTHQAPNALIDEVRLYNRALSQSEVTELYNMGR